MPDIAVIAARAVHIKPIAASMGHWDRIEAEAFGHSPRAALRVGLLGSTQAWTATVDGVPVAMWGVTPISWFEGKAWMLGTDESRRHARAFLESGRATIGDMLGTYDRLSNHVAAGNAAARRMLRHWGFTIGDKVEQFGGVDFLPFSIERPINVPVTAG